MSILTIAKQYFPSADFGGESSLPPVNVGPGFGELKKPPMVDEDDGLFLHHAPVYCSYPYRQQDLYDRALNETAYDVATLENEHLKATFLPAFGGKLWSLFDKDAGKELLYVNTVVRPCNLAIRNAWMSGGVEWNCGYIGHHPHTCTLLTTAKTALDDGTPVLRFYYYERIRAVIVQMDFFLPDGSRFLYARMRITNPNKYVTPVYWWSNIAVVENEGDRNIVPADSAFTPYEGTIAKVKIPGFAGIDNTYPRKNTYAIDYFYSLDDNRRRYTCQLSRDGYGLCQTSTHLLQGRKLFVWGNSQGGHRWCNFLSDDASNVIYDEIQCGLAHSQYEHLPMPPRTVWEWVEAYGAMQADPAKVHGDWHDAQAEVESIFDDMLPAADLDRLLADTRAMAKSKAEVILWGDTDWAALEQRRSEKTGFDLMASHLDFGSLTEAQDTWVSLLENGTVGTHDPKDIPDSYQIAPEWLDLLAKAVADRDKDNWYAYYLLGTAKLAQKEFDAAKTLLTQSVSLCESAWALYALSIIESKTEGIDAESYMLRAYALRPDDLSLAKETLRLLDANKKTEQVVFLYENAPDHIRSNNRCKLYYTCAVAALGDLAKAEQLLCHDPGYLVVPDIREGEVSVTNLWIEIQKKKGLSRKEMGEVPRDLDFRMQAVLESEDA